jgi:type IV pilus assembly protein PilP
MTESSKDLKGRVQPLPEIKALPAISYDSGELLPPFAVEKLFAEEIKVEQQGKGNGKKINTDAFPLARVPLETVRLLGTIVIGNKVVGVVTAGSDAPRRITAGDYVGQNNGRVIAIYPATDKKEAQVLIKEVVLEKGAWIEKDAWLTSSGQGDQN